MSNPILMVRSLSRVPPPVVRKTAVAGWPLFFCSPQTVAAVDFESAEKEVAHVLPVSGEHSQCHEASDPEYGQDDRQ